MRVAVLAGGRSSEHDVSLRSAAAVREGLERAGHETVVVDVARSGEWTTEGRLVVVEPAGGLLDAEVVFPVLHGPFGEDGTVQGLLETIDVAYAGPGVLSAAVEMDKLICKRLIAFWALP
ncbi:MAG: D-alanine--D-alanine ligase A, partial [Thermoleophilaceae bacterium]